MNDNRILASIAIFPILAGLSTPGPRGCSFLHHPMFHLRGRERQPVQHGGQRWATTPGRVVVDCLRGRELLDIERDVRVRVQRRGGCHSDHRYELHRCLHRRPRARLPQGTGLLAAVDTVAVGGRGARGVSGARGNP